jgi:hypothetical protein
VKHFVRGGRGINANQEATLRVKFNEGRRLLTINGEAPTDDLGVVVGSLNQRGAAPVAGIRGFWRRKPEMVDGAAFGALASKRQALYGGLLVNLKEEDGIQNATACLKD